MNLNQVVIGTAGMIRNRTIRGMLVTLTLPLLAFDFWRHCRKLGVVPEEGAVMRMYHGLCDGVLLEDDE